MRKFVSYFRVSTLKQGKSKLGLDAQQNSVRNFVGKEDQVISEFTEIETGTNKRKRVEIYKAIELAKSENAILLVAKLDRLSRNVEFTSALFSAGVEFICIDNPNANKLTIQLLSVIAEHEAEQIGIRIKNALQEKKRRIASGNYTNKDGSMMNPIDGEYRLGNSIGFGGNQKLGNQKVMENSRNHKANVQATSVILNLREKGMTYQAIANELNDLQYQTRYNKSFSPTQAQRLYKRATQ